MGFNSAFKGLSHVRSGGVAPLIHTLSARCKGQVSFTSLPLYPRWKRPRYPLNRRVSVSQNQSGRFRQNKNLLTLPGIEPQFLGRPAQLLLVSKGSCSVIFSHLETKTLTITTKLTFLGQFSRMIYAFTESSKKWWSLTTFLCTRFWCIRISRAIWN